MSPKSAQDDADRPQRTRYVAVIGSGDADRDLCDHAHVVGRTIGAAGFGVVCDGLGGVMAAVCAGAHSCGARTLGILPGSSTGEGNPWLDTAVPTGTGYARNIVVVLTSEAVVVVGGASGTLSEIAHAWQLGRPLAAFVPAGGWGARLAGTSLDGKHSGRIRALHDVDELAEWLRCL